MQPAAPAEEIGQSRRSTKGRRAGAEWTTSVSASACPFSRTSGNSFLRTACAQRSRPRSAKAAALATRRAGRAAASSLFGAFTSHRMPTYQGSLAHVCRDVPRARSKPRGMHLLAGKCGLERWHWSLPSSMRLRWQLCPGSQVTEETRSGTCTWLCIRKSTSRPTSGCDCFRGGRCLRSLRARTAATQARMHGRCCRYLAAALRYRLRRVGRRCGGSCGTGWRTPFVTFAHRDSGAPSCVPRRLRAGRAR